MTVACLPHTVGMSDDEASDVVAFLRARLDEDEAAARAATAGPWRNSPDKHHHIVGTSLFEEAVFAGASGDEAVCVAGTGETDDRQSMDDATHVARHDPARVLREVEAKRRILDEVVSDMDSMTHQIHGEWGVGPLDPDTFESLTLLRLLTLPYADHPSYREEWRP